MSKAVDGDNHSALPRREQLRLQTQDVIFKAAMVEISAVGLANMKIDTVAKKAGVTRPTIYAHFPTKEDFLRELELRTQQRALSLMQQHIGSATGLDLIHKMIDAIFELLERTPQTLRREVFGFVIRHPAKANWSENALFSFLHQSILQGQQAGDIPKGYSPEELVQISTTSIFGFLAVEAEDAEGRRKRCHQMVGLLFS
ncbi:hypothetical protein SIN8267_03517 [Sinobacterium norvegicum]|uniref:HTH tetR-type domain-containing protein n=1 Tax=Sinobacterium norvegicum TaxID=1641715 RepID=A0ABM9AJF0_9GAMM|nr:TetR/AcrR family transcriptional regulator [Sinobacterium norvegicum]CAH0993369.1 hypothetical protein SIN8267_03517 [Sinobacterium norvegicum]